MPTPELYRQLLVDWTTSLRCIPSRYEAKRLHEADLLEARVCRLRPWLEASIGKEKLERIGSDWNEVLDASEPGPCPSEVDTRKARRNVATAIAELERRSLQQANANR